MGADQPSIDSTVDRLRMGDAEAFRALMLQYYDSAERFAYALTRSRQTAEDITQEVFARVWERRGQLDPAKSIKTYLLTAVRHHALDYLKHVGVAQRLEARVVQEYSLAAEQSAPSPEDEFLERAASADRGEIEAALVRAIAGLPEQRRTVLALRFDQQLGFRAIGEILGVSDKAAQQLVIRTIAELKRKLNP